eukprot:GILK01004333.1.p1 GENE.GILK01004333.1~~GILK01004333.1.p1  ORF type:complete len:163 (-),score=7.76 GILK01004333.1:32-520(-)
MHRQHVYFHIQGFFQPTALMLVQWCYRTESSNVLQKRFAATYSLYLFPDSGDKLLKYGGTEAGCHSYASSASSACCCSNLAITLSFKFGCVKKSAANRRVFEGLDSRAAAINSDSKTLNSGCSRKYRSLLNLICTFVRSKTTCWSGRRADIEREEEGGRMKR